MSELRDKEGCSRYEEELKQNKVQKSEYFGEQLFLIQVSLKYVVMRRILKAMHWEPWIMNGVVIYFSSQFSSVAQLCLTLCSPMDCSTPGFPVHHQHPELAQTHVYRVGDAIQPYHPLLSPSPPAFNISQNKGLYQWASSSHPVNKELELQLQHQSFQWIFRTGFF